MASINDPLDPTTGEITDYPCAIYNKLLEVLTKLDTMSAELSGLGTQVNSNVPQASILVNEYYGRQDMDGNGLIYGVDFYITDPPEALRAIRKVGFPMTWAAYMSSIS